MVRWGIRGLETRVDESAALAEGPDCTVELYMSEESEEIVTVLRQGKQLQE